MRMADFVNTIDSMGDKTFADQYLTGKISALNFKDDKITKIKDYAFCYGYLDGRPENKLSSIDFPNVVEVGNYSFAYQPSTFSSVILPSVKVIGEHAFAGCRGVKSINFPELTTMYGDTFRAYLVSATAGTVSSSLNSVHLPKLSELFGENHFYQCYALPSIELPLIKKVAPYMFYGCTNLSSVDFPLVTSVEYSAFYSCKALSWSSINMPLVETIGELSFSECTKLDKIDFPKLRQIGHRAFINCPNLKTFIVRDTTRVCEITGYSTTFITSIFDTNSPIYLGTGYIYVPSALVEDYKNTLEWSMYANQIRAIEDYPDICGATI